MRVATYKGFLEGIMDDKAFVAAVQAKCIELTEKNAEAFAKATPEEKKALEEKIRKDAKHFVKEQERTDALKLVLETVSAIAPDDADLMAAVKLLTKSERGPRSAPVASSLPRVKKTDMLSELFPEIGSEVSENEIYAKYKLGRPDFGRVLRHQIKDAKNPADRLWIAPKDTMASDWDYVLVAKSAEPPADWKGYKPTLTTAEATDKAAATDIVA